MNPIHIPLPVLCTILSLGSDAVAAPQQRPVFLAPTQMPAPTNVAGASSYSMALSADGLRAMVETDRAGGRGGRDIFLLQRASTQSDFTSYGPMGFCTGNNESGARFIDAAAMRVYFSSDRPGGAGGHDLYEWRNGNAIAGPFVAVRSSWDETQPSITSDGLEFFFTSDRPGSLGGRSIWRATRPSVNDPWGSPLTLTAIDSANHEQSASITDDGLFLFFASDRDGDFDIYVAVRASRQSPFGAPLRVAELSGPNHDIGLLVANIGSSGQDGVAATVVGGRTVLLAAEATMTQPGDGLAASTRVAPAELLSVQLRAPVGHLGFVLLGAPMAPIDLPFGRLHLDPRSFVVLDGGIQTDATRLVQVLLPAGDNLHGLPIAMQAMVGVALDLRLGNPVFLTID